MSLWDDISAWLGQQGDPEATGAAQASTAMQPAVQDWLKNVGTGQYAQDTLNRLSQGYDPNASFAQNAQNPTMLQNAMDLALGFSGGGLATRAKGPMTSDLPAPNVGQGTAAPLFDYSRLADVPNVPQFDLPRPTLKTGLPSPEAVAVGDPANLARINAQVAQGVPLGGREWYNTEPLLRAFQEERGADPGQQAYQRYVDLVAATSPKTPVPENLRRASQYFTLDQQGLLNELPPGGLPLHRQNVQNIMDTGTIPVLQNPKPPSFSQNIQGNQQPLTVDVHATRMMGLRNTLDAPVDVPRKTDYWHLEDLGQQQAAQMGLSPAQWQASGWLNQAGLKSPQEPLLQTFENRLRSTAAKMGETPQATLGRFLRGEIPLLSAPVAGLLGSQLIPSGDGQASPQYQ